MKRKEKISRQDKESFAKTIKNTPKPQWTDSYGIHSIKLTESQNQLRNKIIENDLVICEGVAGTGKTLGTLYAFVKEYLADSTKKIIIVRTPVQVGADDVGHLPADLSAKVEFHFESTKKLLETLLNKGKVETDTGHRLQFKIPNFMLGATLDNSLVLVDEGQMLQPLILKMLLERIGENSKVVILGDSSQLYVNAKGRNALRDAIPRFFKDTPQGKVPKYKKVAYHAFDVEDVQRSEFVKTVIRAYST
jgi:phosphate starvation-inducible PhoH-like protein